MFPKSVLYGVPVYLQPELTWLGRGDSEASKLLFEVLFELFQIFWLWNDLLEMFLVSRRIR